jgi:hypothetical protein
MLSAAGRQRFPEAFIAQQELRQVSAEVSRKFTKK